MSDERKTVQVDVISDVVCPWCYVGKKHLEQAIEQVKDRLDVTVQWHPFQLNPAMPEEGRDWKEYMVERFGGPEVLAQAHQRLVPAGAAAGISFAFDRIGRAANTLLAHRLIWMAGQDGGPALQGQVVEGLFRAYFEEGRDIGKRETLLEIAAAAGMDEGQLAQRLDAGEGLEEARGAEGEARQLGVTAVPFFIAGKRLAVSGAQPAEVLAGMLERAAEEGSEGA